MTDFDQPDCAFSAPARAETTTPLQALTMLNHRFTLDMATALADRLRETAGGEVGEDPEEQAQAAFRLLYQRAPDADEVAKTAEAIRNIGLEAVCRALLNSSELIYLD